GPGPGRDPASAPDVHRDRPDDDRRSTPERPGRFLIDMMTSLIRRLHGEEEGYSLVIAILLLSIMMVLLAVALQAGTSSLQQSSLSLEWSKALTVAEAGLDDSITRLGENRSAANPCSMATSTVCSGGGGQYQVSWTQSGGTITVTSIGYYPTMTSPKYIRAVKAS